MARMTQSQVARLLYDAGFRGDALAVMLAVGMGESGLNATIHGDTTITDGTWGDSIGLFQIRSVHADRGSGRWRDANLLEDPWFNARAAYAISSGGTNFRPWTVYKTGKYQDYLPETRALVADHETRGIFEQAPANYQIGPVNGGIPVTDANGLPPGFNLPEGFEDTARALIDAGLVEDPMFAYAREHFGWVAGWLDHDELGPIIREAAEGRWTADRLDAAIEATAYWKETAPAIRDFDQRVLNDPASVDADIQQVALELRNRASRLGIPNLTAERATEMARNALRQGWVTKGISGWNLDGSEIANALSAELSYSPGGELTGTLGSISDEIRKLGSDYLVMLGDEQVFNWTREILAQRQTVEGVEQVLQARALARFPHLAELIQGGTKPAVLFEDYRQLAETELGLPADSVDLLRDQRFTPMLSTPDEKGATRIMTIPEATRHLRKLGGTDGLFGQTKQARNWAVEFSQGLGRMFGEV